MVSAFGASGYPAGPRASSNWRFLTLRGSFGQTKRARAAITANSANVSWTVRDAAISITVGRLRASPDGRPWSATLAKERLSSPWW